MAHRVPACSDGLPPFPGPHLSPTPAARTHESPDGFPPGPGDKEQDDGPGQDIPETLAPYAPAREVGLDRHEQPAQEQDLHHAKGDFAMVGVLCGPDELCVVKRE